MIYPSYWTADTTLVVVFFHFFALLTFYHVGIQMHFIQQFVNRFKGLFSSRKVGLAAQKVPPELISTKYNKLSDFLTGRGKLQSLDSSLSLFLSNVTPVILLAIPTTVYLQGAQYFVSLLSFPIAVIIANQIFVPVFYALRIKTANQYIGKRFNFTVKLLCLVLVIATNLVRMGIWLNTPNLILTNFTVITSETGLLLTVLIVVIYTSLGGMQVMQKMERNQLCIMLFSLSSVISKGIAEVGGIFKIAEENEKNDRLAINYDPSPFTNRHTFWSILSVNTFTWATVYSIQQTTLNRYLPSGSLDTAKRIIHTQIPLMMLFYFVICFIGLLIYTFYFRCDPLMTGRIDHVETLVGLFASDMTYDRGGILGLFIVALYSITLSSISSSLNALSTIVFEDILKFYRLELNFNLFVRISTFIFGILIVITMLCVTLLKQSLKLRTMLTNTLIGPVFGLFLLGLHTRRVNSNCALVTLVAGLLFGIFVFFMHFQDSDTFPSIGIGFEDCLQFFCLEKPEFCEVHQGNLTVVVDSSSYKKPFYRYPFDLRMFRYLSFMFDGWLITVFTVLVGLLLSVFMRQPDKSASEIEECLATYMRRSLPDQCGPAEPEYVHEEDEKSGNGLNQIDLNYLQKAIEEEINRLNFNDRSQPADK